MFISMHDYGSLGHSPNLSIAMSAKEDVPLNSVGGTGSGSISQLVTSKNYSSYSASKAEQNALAKRVDKPDKEPGEDTKAKEAILYLPGIDHTRTAHDMASRIAAALDVISPKAKKNFKARIATPTILPYGSNRKEFQSQVSEVFMEDYSKDDDKKLIKWPIVDVYRFDYHENMTEEWSNAELYRKVLLMFLTIVVYTWTTFRIVLTKMTCAMCGLCKRNYKANGVGIVDILQFFILTILLFVIVLYFVFLVIAAVQAVLRFANVESTFLDYSQQAFTLATFLGFASTTEFKNLLVMIATDYTTTLQYLMFGSQKQQLYGQFIRLVEETRRLGQYERIHIIGYGFGSILAIDALYPLNGKRVNQFENLANFVTVGCPFDMVRTYLPQYYSNMRKPIEYDQKICWTNIFVPGDIFASNFSDTPKENNAEPEVTVFGNDSSDEEKGTLDIGRPTKNVPHHISPNYSLQLISSLFAAGLTSHGQYWDDSPSGADVSMKIARSIFESHWFVTSKEP